MISISSPTANQVLTSATVVASGTIDSSKAPGWLVSGYLIKSGTTTHIAPNTIAQPGPDSTWSMTWNHVANGDYTLYASASFPSDPPPKSSSVPFSVNAS